MQIFQPIKIVCIQANSSVHPPKNSTAYSSKTHKSSGCSIEMLTINTENLEEKLGTSCEDKCTQMINYIKIPTVDLEQLWNTSEWTLIGEGRCSSVYQVAKNKALKARESPFYGADT